MKFLLVIPDGWADKPQASIDNRTPLETAKIDTINSLAKEGTVGTVQILTEESPTDTSVALLTIFGIENAKLSVRGYYEALDWGLELEEGEFAARLQLVSAKDNAIVSPTSGNLTSAEAKQLITLLNDEIDIPDVEFYFASRNNHIVVFRGNREKMPALASPWEVLNKPFMEYLPPSDNELTKVMMRCSEILEKAEINEVRRSIDESPVNFAYIWGMGKSQQYFTIRRKLSTSVALVSYSTMARGLAIAAGANMVFQPEESNEPRKELRYLYQETRKALVQHDLVVAHLGFPDNYVKAGGVEGKVQALKMIDELFIAPIAEELKKYEKHRLLIVPTLGSDSSNRVHLKEPVPFLAWGDSIKFNGNTGYSEVSGQKTNYHLNEGQRILEYFWRLK